MPKIIDIIKTRWSEVVLLIGLQTAVMFLLEQIAAVAQPPEGAPVSTPQNIAFLLGLGTMAFIIVWQMLYLGFLRTCIEGVQPWEPFQLLRVGRYYFWRTFRFQILLFVAFFGLAAMGLSIVAAITRAQNPDELSPLALAAVLIVTSLALLKPTALCLPVMLVRNVMAINSIMLLPAYRLRNKPAIPALYIAAMIFSAAVSIVDRMYTPTGAPHHALMAVHHLIVSLTVLLIHLMALQLITKLKGSDTFSEEARTDAP